MDHQIKEELEAYCNKWKARYVEEYTLYMWNELIGLIRFGTTANGAMVTYEELADYGMNYKEEKNEQA